MTSSFTICVIGFGISVLFLLVGDIVNSCRSRMYTRATAQSVTAMLWVAIVVMIWSARG